MKFTTSVIFEDANSNVFAYETITKNVFFKMVSLFLLQGCNLSCTVDHDLLAALHELASARAHTLLKLITLRCLSRVLRWPNTFF